MFIIHEMLMSKSECQASYQCEVLAPGDCGFIARNPGTVMSYKTETACVPA